MKKTISIILAACLLLSASVMAAAAKTVVNIISRTGNVVGTSTVYAGEVIADGGSVIRYLYSDDISASNSVLAALRDALGNSGLEGFDGLVTYDCVAETPGLTVCSADGYTEDMNKDWTDAEIAAAPIVRGDADGNGSVNINDVTAIQRHLAEFALLTGDRFTAADANADGVITIDDATAVQRFLAEYSDPYRIGEYIAGSDGSQNEENETELIPS